MFMENQWNQLEDGIFYCHNSLITLLTCPMCPVDSLSYIYGISTKRSVTLSYSFYVAVFWEVMHFIIMVVDIAKGGRNPHFKIKPFLQSPSSILIPTPLKNPTIEQSDGLVWQWVFKTDRWETDKRHTKWDEIVVSLQTVSYDSWGTNAI